MNLFGKKTLMPALLTHNYFGQDVMPHLDGAFFHRPDDEGASTELRNAFLLGNQGPDPLFFVLLSSHMKVSKEFGSLMHHAKISETIEAFRDLAFAQEEPQRSLLLAYVLGFVCHFTLDSILHPFVYAQQNAFCDAGIEGLDCSDGPVVHGQIEADLDAMFLCQRDGLDVRRHDYTKNVLRANESTLTLLDSAYRRVAKDVYGIELPVGLFARGVKDYRLTIKVLYSPRGSKRSLLGAIERLVRRHSLLQAITLRADVGETCAFDNHEQREWTDPFTDLSSTASFADLYHRALTAARENTALLIQGDAALKLTKGLDFEGAPCHS